MKLRRFYVYILTSRSGVLYIGITNNLERRMCEHKNKWVPGFTAKYNVDRLVHYETFTGPHHAIAREKQIKGWRREKKIRLIEETNPTWKDLSVDWYTAPTVSQTTASLAHVSPPDVGSGYPQV